MNVLFFAKQDDPLAERAARYLDQHADGVCVHFGNRDLPFPELELSGVDYVISYLSPWIIPADVLAAARIAAINLHPGPPEYPGIGCTNFAIYEEAESFGITCHHMAASVDTGNVISVRRFPIYPHDTVLSLTERCYSNIAEEFYAIADIILAEKELPVSDEQWTRRPFRRKELNALCRINPEMDPTEIRRRVRATNYPGYPGAYLELAGCRFDYSGEV